MWPGMLLLVDLINRLLPVLAQCDMEGRVMETKRVGQGTKGVGRGGADGCHWMGKGESWSR